MISDIKTMWEPDAADVRQGHMRRIELAVERDAPLLVPLQGLRAPSWWTSCRIFAEDASAFFSVSIACNDGNGPTLETWVQPAGAVNSLTWPIPGDLAQALDLTLVVRYMGGLRECVPLALTLGFHELERYVANERFAFVDAGGTPAMFWDAGRGVGGLQGTDAMEFGTLYVVVPPMNRLVNDVRWQDIHCRIDSWNDIVPL